MSKISFIKSDNRKYNIERCLSLIKSEIMTGLKNAGNVVVKPTCPTDNLRLAATNAEALEGLLEFIKPYTKGQIILAEGVERGDTLTAFKNFDYLPLQEKYDLAIIDLNKDELVTIPLIDSKKRIWKAKTPKTILDSDYLISITPPKTDGILGYYGAIKNASVGMPSSPEKNIFSIFNRNSSEKIFHHHNLRKLYDRIPLRLAILDAFEAMQGDGPVSGEMVAAHWAVASSDSVAADFMATQLMGIDIKDVPYLSALEGMTEETGDYFVIGDDWKKNIIKFKPHSNFSSF